MADTQLTGIWVESGGELFPRWHDPCTNDHLDGCIKTDGPNGYYPYYDGPIGPVQDKCMGPYSGCLDTNGCPVLTIPDDCCCEYCDIPCFEDGKAPWYIDVTIAGVVKQTWVSDPPFCTTVPNPAPAPEVNGTWRCDYIGTFAGGCYYQYGPISSVTVTIYLYTDGSMRVLAQYDGWTQYDYQPAAWDCGVGPYDGETCIQYNTDAQCTADCGNYHYEDGQTATFDNVNCTTP